MTALSGRSTIGFRQGTGTGAALYATNLVEAIARIAYFTLNINATAKPVGSTLHDKHHLRKRGPNAYHGQTKEKA